MTQASQSLALAKHCDLRWPLQWDHASVSVDLRHWAFSFCSLGLLNPHKPMPSVSGEGSWGMSCSLLCACPSSWVVGDLVGREKAVYTTRGTSDLPCEGAVLSGDSFRLRTWEHGHASLGVGLEGRHSLSSAASQPCEPQWQLIGNNENRKTLNSRGCRCPPKAAHPFPGTAELS
jgi:hypothetical protein